MNRYMLTSIFCASVLLVFSADAAQAGVISRNNPYRSFNTSGVNYGSMQWEHKYGNKSHKSWNRGRSSGRLFRRW